MSENKLHTAVMEAVDLLNGILPKIHSHEKLRQAHDILRQALVDYADEALKKQPAGHAMAVELIESGAPNYYVERLETSVTRDIEVMARYIDGETPTEQLEKAFVKIAKYEMILGAIADGFEKPAEMARSALRKDK